MGASPVTAHRAPPFSGGERFVEEGQAAATHSADYGSTYINASSGQDVAVGIFISGKDGQNIAQVRLHIPSMKVAMSSRFIK
jgi:hypothetical protein